MERDNPGVEDGRTCDEGSCGSQVYLSLAVKLFTVCHLIVEGILRALAVISVMERDSRHDYTSSVQDNARRRR